MKNNKISIIDQKGPQSPVSPIHQLSPMSPFNQNKRNTKLQNQIQDVLSQLSIQKQEYLKEKEKERRDLIKQKQRDQLKLQIIQTYQKSMAERKPFVGMPNNQHQVFERDRSKFLKAEGYFPDKNPEYFMQPARAKDPRGFHVSSGNDSSSNSLFGKIDESKMSYSERRRYQIWEEIRKQKEKEQSEMIHLSQNGNFKKEKFYDSKLNQSNNNQRIFKPTDSRHSLFTVNPSSVYEVPRTPKQIYDNMLNKNIKFQFQKRSTRKLIQIGRNLEKNHKWNPNTSVINLKCLILIIQKLLLSKNNTYYKTIQKILRGNTELVCLKDIQNLSKLKNL